MQMAVETPTMLPVPTREAVETISAPKEEMPPLVLGFSDTTRKDSPSRRTCMNLLRKVKNRPAARSRKGTQGMYRTPLMAVTTLSMPSQFGSWESLFFFKILS